MNGTRHDQSWVHDGHEYPFDDHYYNAVSAVRPLSAVADIPLYEKETIGSHPKTHELTSFRQFVTKYYETLLFYELLSEAGRLRPFDRALDIGSGPALQLRTIKAHGYAKHIEACDLYDGTARCPDSMFSEYLHRTRWFGRVAKVVGSLPLPVAVRNKFPVGAGFYQYWPDISPYTWPLKDTPALNRYLVTDFFGLQGQYDLISSYMALEYFDFEEVAHKVDELLVPGGVFVFLVSYWWFPVNNTLLYGRFPYLLQQLDRDAVIDYYQEAHPQLNIEGIRSRLNHSDKSTPNVDDYKNIAGKYNLEHIGTRRLSMGALSNPRSIVGYDAINAGEYWSLEKVMANIRRRKENIVMEDLKTSHVMLAFQKK